MKNISVMFFAVFSGLLLGSASRAEQVPELTRYFDTQIAALDHAVVATEATHVSDDVAALAAATPESNEMMYLNLIYLRIRGTLGIEIPGLTRFEIIPETELIWQRIPPAGWVPYRR